MEVVITGFDKFTGVPDNFSKKIVEKLKNDQFSCANGTGTTIDIKYKILEVSVDACNDFYKSFDDDPKNRVFIHFGQGDKGAIKLEQCAYNRMFFFPYADEKGYMPKPGDPIIPPFEINPSLTTSLPLSAIREEFQLNSQSIGANNDAVVISSDPGRFVCNYVYYKSLLHQKSKGSPLNSLFIHVPPSDPQATDHEATVVQIAKQLITSVVCKAGF